MADSRRRFTVKPFRTHGSMDRQEAAETWQVLESALDEIYHRNASQLSFEELYRAAYRLVLHKYGDYLYENVSTKLTTQLQEQVVPLLWKVPDASILDKMAEVWKEHVITITMIRDILMYMDRIYVVQQRRRPVYELGLHLFRTTVWEHPAVRPRVVQSLLDAVDQERRGSLSDDRDLYKTVVGMMLELNDPQQLSVYQQDWEPVFLASTQEFYNAESLQYVSSATAVAYVRKAADRIAHEKERCVALQLPATTVSPLMSLVQTEWIERHAKTLVDMETTGFAAMLEQDKKEEMREMYQLFSAIPSSVEHLREALAERIKSVGRKLLQESDPSSFCKSVLELRSTIEGVVEHSFLNESKAQKRMRESFEDFLNMDARAASCLAVYVDELLRVGLRGATDDYVHAQLQQAIIIFRYLADKDVFENFYKQHLAKRLLGNKSVSDDAEKAMVSLLKAECGYQFTTKLEGMFNDMRISRETRDKYKTYSRNQRMQQQQSPKSTVDLEVDVLTGGNWPTQNAPPCTLPTVIQQSIDNFSEFYLTEHSGRRLSWQTFGGAAEIRATYAGGRRHELCVSTFQMCILVLFNAQDTLTLGQIRMQTQIPDAELRRHLISLCTPKNRILKKGSKGKGITSDSDTFTYNAEYSSKLKRVRIPLVKESSLQSSSSASGAAKPAAAMTTQVPVAVEEDRRHLVEAAIVRIMKARRTLDHNNLIAEVTKQLSVRFTPTPQFIKKRIESLMEREYLERNEKEHRLYQYVA